MKNLLRKLREDALSEPDHFESDVNLSILAKGDAEIEHNSKVNLQYRIEIEYRTWGIKGIYLGLDKPAKIFYSIEGQDEQKELEIDFGKLSDEHKLNISWNGGSGYFVEGIDVYLDESGAVESVDVNAVYDKPV